MKDINQPGGVLFTPYKLPAYTMINGDARQSVFWHMLQHVVNHASYHRGQVTTMVRQLGATPPQGMDLITFYRTMRPS